MEKKTIPVEALYERLAEVNQRLQRQEQQNESILKVMSQVISNLILEQVNPRLERLEHLVLPRESDQKCEIKETLLNMKLAVERDSVLEKLQALEEKQKGLQDELKALEDKQKGFQEQLAKKIVAPQPSLYTPAARPSRKKASPTLVRADGLKAKSPPASAAAPAGGSQGAAAPAGGSQGGSSLVIG